LDELNDSSRRSVEDLDDVDEKNLLIFSTEKLKDLIRMTKSSRRDPHGRCQLTKVNSANILDEGL
jgi:hypothetical protein